MLIWIFHPYDPSLSEGVYSRSSYIAQYLLDLGCDIVHLKSSFDHVGKKEKLLCHSDAALDNYSVITINSLRYNKNVGFKRIVFNYFMANSLKKKIKTLKKPDLILTFVPVIETAYALSKFSSKNNIPFVVDYRDYWPDIFKEYLPRKLRFLYKFIFAFSMRRHKYVFTLVTVF